MSVQGPEVSLPFEEISSKGRVLQTGYRPTHLQSFTSSPADTRLLTSGASAGWAPNGHNSTTHSYAAVEESRLISTPMRSDNLLGSIRGEGEIEKVHAEEVSISSSYPFHLHLVSSYMSPSDQHIPSIFRS
jgi:hypothetical protein